MISSKRMATELTSYRHQFIPLHIKVWASKKKKSSAAFELCSIFSKETGKWGGGRLILFNHFSQLMHMCIQCGTQTLSSNSVVTWLPVNLTAPNNILRKGTWHPLVVKYKFVSKVIAFFFVVVVLASLWLWARKILQYIERAVHPKEKLTFKKI